MTTSLMLILSRKSSHCIFFDSKFGEKALQLAADYDIPVYFREDLFSILGNDHPDFRWLIAGPARSGSSFHIDPNSTSAWNAVVRGSKKWLLYPLEVVPPGVHPSPDGADVASPVSITEWFHELLWGDTAAQGETCGVYLSGRRNLLNVLEFLNRPNSKELVSGTMDCVNLYEKFQSKYEQLFPGSIESLQQQAEARKLQNQKACMWDTITDVKTGGFKFGFS
ncbi:unnamed protein product [Sphagnum jensenii]|uniref:JmjC domain-containing protein n=1 Tax=Sphagnum jensenii TaxID=128206 RepID=A0ABP0W7B7_9BRYO